MGCGAYLKSQESVVPSLNDQKCRKIHDEENLLFLKYGPVNKDLMPVFSYGIQQEREQKWPAES